MCPHSSAASGGAWQLLGRRGAGCGGEPLADSHLPIHAAGGGGEACVVPEGCGSPRVDDPRREAPHQVWGALSLSVHGPQNLTVFSPFCCNITNGLMCEGAGPGLLQAYEECEHCLNATQYFWGPPVLPFPYHSFLIGSVLFSLNTFHLIPRQHASSLV